MLDRTLAGRETTERYGLMEARLKWLGFVRRADLSASFGVSSSVASRVAAGFFDRFRHLIADTAQSKHSFSLLGEMSPEGEPDSNEVLRLIAAQSGDLPYGAGQDRWFPDVPYLDIDGLLMPDHDGLVVREVMRAIALRQVLEIDYVSRRRSRVIALSPHSLVAFRGGTYARGLVWKDGKAEGLTLKLTRMKSPVRHAGLEALPSHLDIEMRACTLRFTLSPGLGQDVRAMLDAENRLNEGGERVIVVPRAFKDLVIRDMVRPRKLGAEESVEQPHWVLADEGHEEVGDRTLVTE